ncbi:uncharacterized protein LOC142165299 [Nicotiana tabacum]|uniref:Uncharacterized protein LOC142165299 n=1 Tax=Nicotiana tabacum TaxID=4097 RepID=A0AC58S4R9_TOBAC
MVVEKVPEGKYIPNLKITAVSVVVAYEMLKNGFVLGPSRFWQKEVLHDIMTTCIILHSMIIENEHDLNAPIQDDLEDPTPTVEMTVDENQRFQEFLARHRRIKDKDAHFALHNALIDHLWENTRG